MRKVYAARRAALIDAIATLMPDDLTVSSAATGLHLVAFFTERMRARLSDTQAAKLLLKTGIHVQPLSQNYLGEPTRQGLVFGYGRLQTEDAHRLISKMAEALSGRTS
jgi:GntR family transcriptional regulator/MocR family aminotransferase